MTQKITQTDRMATKWIRILYSTRRETKKVIRNTGFGKVQNNKQPSADGEQNTGIS